jgi:hypothetical protein
MTTSFKWSVTAMDCYPKAAGQTNVAFNIYWTCKGYLQGASSKDNCGNGGNNGNGGGTKPPVTPVPPTGIVTPITASTSGVCPATYIAGTPYTEYKDLTEDQVLQWVWSSSGNKEATENYVQKLIDEQVNPSIIQPALPWVA